MTDQFAWVVREDQPPTATRPRETHGFVEDQLVCTVVEFVLGVFEVRYTWFDPEIAFLTFDTFEAAQSFARRAWRNHQDGVIFDVG